MLAMLRNWRNRRFLKKQAGIDQIYFTCIFSLRALSKIPPFIPRIIHPTFPVSQSGEERAKIGQWIQRETARLERERNECEVFYRQYSLPPEHTRSLVFNAVEQLQISKVQLGEWQQRSEIYPSEIHNLYTCLRNIEEATYHLKKTPNIGSQKAPASEIDF